MSIYSGNAIFRPFDSLTTPRYALFLSFDLLFCSNSCNIWGFRLTIFLQQLLHLSASANNPQQRIQISLPFFIYYYISTCTISSALTSVPSSWHSSLWSDSPTSTVAISQPSDWLPYSNGCNIWVFRLTILVHQLQYLSLMADNSTLAGAIFEPSGLQSSILFENSSPTTAVCDF